MTCNIFLIIILVKNIGLKIYNSYLEKIGLRNLYNVNQYF